MIVKLTQSLNNGLAPWKEMVHNNAHKMKEHGFRAIFAGTEAGDDSKLTVIMEFDSPESMEAFKNDAELTQARIEAGADLESTVVTPMSSDSFSNFPE
tara:strand:- start:170 stop:463 length:294 start_codon:yes stop_codon:yes gene_type:complete